MEIEMDRFSLGYDGDRHKGRRIATLWTDDSIDGDVTFSPYWDELTWTAKADLIGDIIGLLERERDLLIDHVPDPVRYQFGWPLRETSDAK
jgi:hypothetical protein